MCTPFAAAQSAKAPIPEANAYSPRQLDGTAPPQPAAIRELIQQKEWSEASAAAEEALQKNPADVNVMYWLGVMRLQLHDYIGATRALRSAQKGGIQTAAMHIELGHAYYGLHQYLLFEEQMRTASELDPKNHDPKYSMGLYRLHVLSDVAGALILFREAAELQPDDWRSPYQVGYCLELSAQPAEARQVYLQDIQLLERKQESFGWPYQGMARLLLEEDTEEALRYAKLAVDVEPGEYSNHLTLAKVYEKMGNFKNAVAEGRVAADQNPTDASVRYFLFMLYRRAGDLGSAEREMAVFNRLHAVYDSE
jgi:tetratricopeptide (TPR) repeat protein